MTTATVPETQQRVLALNTTDVPFTVSAAGDTITATWKYADVKWGDIISGGGVQAGYELVVTFDEAQGHYELHETTSGTQHHWEIGPNGISLEGGGAASSGKHWSKTFGAGAALHVEQDGQDAGHTYHYSFSPQVARNAVVDAVEAAGWTKQPSRLGKLFHHDG